MSRRRRSKRGGRRTLLLLLALALLAAGAITAIAVASLRPSDATLPTPRPAVAGGTVSPDELAARATATPATPVTLITPTATATATPATIACDPAVKIGLVADLSGEYAAYGEMVRRAFLLGMEYATAAPGDENGVFRLENCQIQVLVRDDQGLPERAGEVGRELVEQAGVNILVGTVTSASTAVLQQIALENQVVLIVAPAGANDLTGVDFNRFTFRTSRENYQDYINLCQYLTARYHLLAQIAPDYSLGHSGAAAARSACEALGGKFAIDDILAPLATIDFEPYLTRIKESGAEAWIVSWAGGGYLDMLQAAQEMGLLDELAVATTYFDNATMAEFGSLVGQTGGIVYHYTLPANPVNDWLVEQVRSRYGVPPDLFDADGMNAALLIVAALKATRGNASSEALIAAMEGMEFEGPKGTIVIRPEDHVAIQDMYVVTLTNVDDPEYRFYEPVMTTRPRPPCLLSQEWAARCGDLPVDHLSPD